MMMSRKLDGPWIRRLVISLHVVFIAGGVVCILRPWWQDFRSAAIVLGLVEQVVPAEGDPSKADEAMQAICAVAGDRAAVCEKAVAVLTADLEPAQGEVALRRDHERTSVRAAANALATELKAAFEDGRADDALRLVEAGHRMARLYGGGRSGMQALLHKMVGLALHRTIDDAVKAAVEARAVPASARARLHALYRTALERETGIDRAVAFELDLMERCAQAFDRSEGFLRQLDLSGRGDALAQARTLRADWTAGRAVLLPAGAHFIVHEMLPHITAAKERFAAHIAVRQQILATLAR